MENNTSKIEETDEMEEDHDESAKGFEAVVDTFPIILAVFIIIANSLGLVLFARNRRLRTITNTFLVSLAISDLLTGLFGIPFYLICSAVTQQDYCRTAMLCWRFTSTSTVLHLLAVTLDRYAAIVHAIRYHTIVTRTVAKTTILMIWLTSFFVSLIQLSWQPNDEELSEMSDEEMEQAWETYKRKTSIYLVSTLLIFFLLPLMVMVYSYVRIIIIVRYHEKQMKKHNMPSTRGVGEPLQKKNSSFNIQAQWKSAIVFLVMILVYVICWLPFFLYSLREQLDLFRLPHWAEYVFFYYPRFVTSLSNPLFYIIGKHDFRKALCPKKQNHNGTQMTSLIGRGEQR
ncbi:beta-1 adrenergic receptor-like [Actinia tenebrosa]|uniref:Beta-1 adrenergic receptor-like n=1 Tax=Actinia tenebrosa TaxID=6105 RepID=A0A6P8JBY5_ACTTE|nr:beta-1 adrenergic receptor-like [Actinia tenebrosa]XP_031575154.1 beta-1 adrenergic receptor-like [Actinia tenebrosa]XP_031575155.1 beta-1 adrenergic receptor-like [Actinia tenebrosa]